MIVLFIGPHTDDIEIHCGGTVANFLREGHKIVYIALSAAERSNDGFNLRQEAQNACNILNIETSLFYDYPVRDFTDHRQNILELFCKLRDHWTPDLIIGPSRYDLHQDHITVHNEILRAFIGKSSVWGFETHKNIEFAPTQFVILKSEDINLKLRAVDCFKSQRGKSYMTKNAIISNLIARGAMIEADYAEAYSVSRNIRK